MSSRKTRNHLPGRVRYGQVGFSQRIRLEWLEKTANLVLAGNDKPSIYSALQEMLENKLSVGGNSKRGNREKAISILMKIWIQPSHELHSFRHDGLQLLASRPRKEHIAVHWGMAMAVYPFWGAVAAQVGRLLRLQEYASHSQVRRRMQEQYGERPTVKDATRRVLRSMIDWGVLQTAQQSEMKHSPDFKKGIYATAMSQAIDHPPLIAWLAEAVLHAQASGSMTLQALLDSTSLFPFRLAPASADRLVMVSDRLEVLRHGLDQELIMLRE